MGTEETEMEESSEPRRPWILEVFSRMGAWFVNLRDIVFAPVTIHKQIVIILAAAIEETDAKEVKEAALKRALGAGVADRLHKIIKQEVEEKP